MEDLARNNLDVPFDVPLVRDMDMLDVVVEYTYRTENDPSGGQAPGGFPEGAEPQGPPQSFGPDNPAPARADPPAASSAPTSSTPAGPTADSDGDSARQRQRARQQAHREEGEQRRTKLKRKTPASQTIYQNRAHIGRNTATTANDKRVRTAYATNQVMCESFAAERADRATKGEMDIKEVLKRSDNYTKERTEKCLNALIKEWSTWTKYDAVTVITPTMAKKIDKSLQIESRA
eukprot:9103806-Pyramimonas_sp.AAC.1